MGERVGIGSVSEQRQSQKFQLKEIPVRKCERDRGLVRHRHDDVTDARGRYQYVRGEPCR